MILRENMILFTMNDRGDRMRKLLILDAKTTLSEFAELVRGPILRLVPAGSVFYVWTEADPDRNL